MSRTLLLSLAILAMIARPQTNLGVFTDEGSIGQTPPGC